MQNNNKKTVNKIDREAVFLAEYIMQDLMTACLSMDRGFIAAVEIEDDGGWYLGDTIIEGEADVKLSTTAEFEDAQTFTQTAMSCLLYTSPSPRDGLLSRMPSSA